MLFILMYIVKLESAILSFQLMGREKRGMSDTGTSSILKITPGAGFTSTHLQLAQLG